MFNRLNSKFNILKKCYDNILNSSKKLLDFNYNLIKYE